MFWIFQSQFEKNCLLSLKATLPISLGIPQKICFKKVILYFLNFLRLGLRFFFNKLGYHIYVYDSNIILYIILYICLMYIFILYNILYGIKYKVSYHILICNLLKCNCVTPPSPNLVFILWLLHLQNYVLKTFLM